MNREVLRYPDFWALMRNIGESPHDQTAKDVVSDWLEEHDSPLRAHIIRHGVPEQQTGDDETRRSAVALGDEAGHPRQLRGHSDYFEAPHAPLATHQEGPETYELFRAASLADRGPDRLVVRYTLHSDGGHVRLVAPVSLEHIRQIGHAGNARVWNAWEDAARMAEHPRVRNRYTQEPVLLARVTVAPPVAGPVPFGGNGPINEHALHDAAGKHIGVIRVQPRNDGKTLHIHWVGLNDANEAEDANRLGPEAVRSAMAGLAEHYPQAEFVTGLRGTGFRGQANAERVMVPIRRAKLARMKAPANGAIVNNTYQKGGQFLAKARQRIRDVAARLVKLARPDEVNYNALVSGINKLDADFQTRPDPQLTDTLDPTPRLAFADLLQEHGIPGAHVIRAHVTHDTYGANISHDRRLFHLLGLARENGPIVSLGPDTHSLDGGTHYGPDGVPDVTMALDPFTAHVGEDPLAQILWSHQAHRGGALLTLHHNPEGQRLLHAAPFKTVDELRALAADFPAEARRRLIGGVEAGIQRRALTGRGARRPLRLARSLLPPVDMSAHGLIGHAVRDTPLTLGQLKAVEDRYRLPDRQRLSTAPGIVKTTDDQPYTVKVSRIKQFIHTLSQRAMPTRQHLKILSDPGVSDGEKLTHLVAQIGADYASAEHPPEGESWYGGQVSHLDRMIHKTGARGKPHPLWGTLDKYGELIGKDNPAENHPGLVLLKAIIAATSGGQNPRDNLSSAVRAWAAGRRAGHPIEALPEFNHEALAEWIAGVKKLHGPGANDPVFDTDLRTPGTTPTEKGAWFARFIAPIRQQLRDVAHGYSAQDARVVPESGHVVWIKRNDRIVKHGREQPGAVNVALPNTDDTGRLKPKGWGQRATQVAERLSLIKGVYGHFKKLHPADTELATMRKAADWLIAEHKPVDFDRMAEALKEHTADLPHLKPQYASSKAIFGKGFSDETDPKLPGMMILGPKFGAFAMNLHSNDPTTAARYRQYLTADMWWTRNFLRYLGRMGESPGVNDRRQMLKAVQKVTRKMGVTPADLQADLWYHEQALYRMLGADAKHVESLSYRDAANDLLDPRSPKALHVKLARLVDVIRQGETAHAALTRILKGRTSRVHGRTASIHQQPNGDIGVTLHGNQIVTAHPNGQVTLDHHGFMIPTVRRFMSGFSGHGVSFAGKRFLVNGEPYENGTAYPPAPTPTHTWTTVPPTDPELRAFVYAIRPSQADGVDETAAKVFADWLDEHNDWRAPILRSVVPYSEYRPAFDYAGTAGSVGHNGTLNYYASPTYSHIDILPDGRIQLHTRIGDLTHQTIVSHMTPEEYETMRRNAATAGAHFPEAAS